MITDLNTLMTKYKSTLKKIEGGHSFAIIEHYQETDTVAIHKKNNIDYISKISWLDLQSAYESYNAEGIWKNHNSENVPSVIVQRMQEAWAFQKMFNSSKMIEFQDIDSDVYLIINEIKNVLDNWKASIVNCKEMYFDHGGNDYWMIILYSKESINVLEFMHFID